MRVAEGSRYSARLMRILPSFVLALALAACASAEDADKSLADAGSESTISNYYTTVVGELTLGDSIADAIDYPDYYLGRTIEMRAGQQIEISISSDKRSLVHVYGPAYGWYGEQPLFGNALLRTTTTKVTSTKHVLNVRLTAQTAGTYMLVYGPSNVWRATYSITASCTANCPASNVVGEGEACGGFVPAHLFKTCEPSLTCVAPHDILPDAQGNCGITATVAEVLANPQAYAGRFVALSGHVGPGIVGCTKKLCPAEDPCCNTCFASTRIADAAADQVGIALREGGEDLRCTGTECSVTCDLDAGAYWLSGWIDVDADGNATLDVVRRYQAP